MPLLLMFLGMVVFVQLGFQLGRIGWSAWSLKRRSAGAFFLFPVSWHRDKIGVTETAPLLYAVHPPEGAYRAVVFLFWPLLFCWSAVIIAVVLGPDLLSRRVLAKPPTSDEGALEVQRLIRVAEEKSRELDGVIWELEAGPDRERMRRTT